MRSVMRAGRGWSLGVLIFLLGLVGSAQGKEESAAPDRTLSDAPDDGHGQTSEVAPGSSWRHGETGGSVHTSLSVSRRVAAFPRLEASPPITFEDPLTDYGRSRRSGRVSRRAGVTQVALGTVSYTVGAVAHVLGTPMAWFGYRICKESQDIGPFAGLYYCFWGDGLLSTGGDLVLFSLPTMGVGSILAFRGLQSQNIRLPGHAGVAGLSLAAGAILTHVVAVRAEGEGPNLGPLVVLLSGASAVASTIQMVINVGAYMDSGYRMRVEKTRPRLQVAIAPTRGGGAITLGGMF